MAAYKDLTKVKGSFVIRSLCCDAQDKVEDKLYVGYALGLVTVKDAWKFKTKQQAQKAIKDDELNENCYAAWEIV